MMKSIRCGRGFGDSLYLQAAVRHLLLTGGLRMRVASDWPDVWRPLGDRVEVIPFTRRVDIVAHYVMGKKRLDTTQFEDVCQRAGAEGADLRLDWAVPTPRLVDEVASGGRPVLIVQMPRTPMGRTDGFGKTLLPDCRAIQALIDRDGGASKVVQVGAGRPLFDLRGIDLDLANRTTVAETIDAVSVADRCLGYVSFLVPLAESLDKPATFVWSRRGLNDGQPFISSITPRKVLHKASSRAVIDDEVLDVR